VHEALVVDGERRPVDQAVEGDEDPYSQRSVDERHEQRRSRAVYAEVDRGEPESGLDVGDQQRTGAGEHVSDGRALHPDRTSHRRAAELAGRGGDGEAVALAQQHQHRARVGERAAARDDKLEDAIDVGLATDRSRDRRARLQRADGALELAAALRVALDQARVVERDGRPFGEHLHGVLVGRGERSPCLSVT